MSQEQAKQFVDQATQSLQSGQFDQALELIDQAIALDPDSSDTFVLRGIALSQTGQPQAATEAFRKAIMLSPYNAKAYYNLSVHQYAQGNKVEALEMARETAKIDPRHAGARDMMTKIEAELSGDVVPGQVTAQPSNLADPLSGPPAGVPPVSETPSGMVREAAPPSAPPAGPNAPGPSANPYMAPPQGHYVRPGYEQPIHSLPFVANMGGTWTGIGWALVIINVLTAIGFFAILGPAFGTIMQNPQKFQGPGNQAAMRAALGPGASSAVSGLFVISLIFIAVTVLWTILDLVDRRGNWAWLIPVIVCAVPCFCAPYLGPTMFILPFYLLLGRK